MKIAIWTVTRNAGHKGLEISKKINNSTIYTLKKFDIDNSFKVDDFTSALNENFNQYDGHIFIMATGIVVRKIAPLIKSKDIDPAVVVIDENITFAISLLSGHLGGANELVENISKTLNIVPIITTSSDITGKVAVDTIGQKLNSNLESLNKAKNVTALIVDGKDVDLILPKNIVSNGASSGAIIVSNRENVETVQLFPKNLIVGIGARRDISTETVEEILLQTFKKNNLSLKSIKHFATVDLKANEKGIVETAKKYNSELKIVSRDEILKVEDMFVGSDFVKKNIGVKAVSEPCAYITSNKDGKFIEMKATFNGVTLSIYEERGIYEKR